MRFFPLSLRSVLFFSLSVKGCLFCIKLAYHISQSDLDLILKKEDKKQFCYFIENVINEIRQEQRKNGLEEKEVKDKKENDIGVEEVKDKEENEVEDKEMNEVKENEIGKDNMIIEKNMFINENKIGKENKIEKESLNEQSQQTGAIKKKLKFPVKDFDPLRKQFPVKEGNSSKNDLNNPETCELALLERLKNDQKALKVLEMKMNNLKKEAETKETTPKKYFVFREDRPWH